VALVRHVARTLQENEDRLLGRPVDGAASHADTFIDLVNELSGHYAEFPADPAADEAAGFQPGFAFVRYLGSRLEPTVPDKDRRWVLDQVMAIETPEALGIVQRSMHDLFEPDATPARGARPPERRLTPCRIRSCWPPRPRSPRRAIRSTPTTRSPTPPGAGSSCATARSTLRP
jgi:hypothetical protein